MLEWDDAPEPAKNTIPDKPLPEAAHPYIPGGTEKPGEDLVLQSAGRIKQEQNLVMLRFSRPLTLDEVKWLFRLVDQDLQP